MQEIEEMWPQMAPKTLSQLAKDSGVSKRKLVKLINAGKLPHPLQVEQGKFVYPPITYKAVLQIAKDLARRPIGPLPGGE